MKASKWPTRPLKTPTCQAIGLCAAADGHFHKELWMRDIALASSIARWNPQAFVDTLETFLSYQRPDGQLPHRVEYKRHSLQFVPLLNHFSSRSKGYPVYGNSWLATPARDTTSCFIIACGQLARVSSQGREFVQANWSKLVAALDREERFIDGDGMVSGGYYQDWLDCLQRPGKLAGVNVLLSRAYREMALMAKRIRGSEMNLFAYKYSMKAIKLHVNIRRAFWDKAAGYLRAGESDDRFDTAANIFAGLFTSEIEETLSTQRAIDAFVRPHRGLLKNIDRPYPNSQIGWRVKLFGLTNYGNHFLHPWLTSVNILAMLRLAKRYTEPNVRREFLLKAVSDFLWLSQIHCAEGAFHEIFDHETHSPAEHKLFGRTVFSSSPGFIGSVAPYLAAYHELRKLTSRHA